MDNTYSYIDSSNMASNLIAAKRHISKKKKKYKLTSRGKKWTKNMVESGFGEF